MPVVVFKHHAVCARLLVFNRGVVVVFCLFCVVLL
jgi:hypothetical protein